MSCLHNISEEAMTEEELTDGLNEALESMTEENYDPALIDAYLAALDRKAPMPEVPDTAKLNTSSVHRAIAPKTSTPEACAATMPPIRQIAVRTAINPMRQTECTLRLGLAALSSAGMIFSVWALLTRKVQMTEMIILV